MTGKILYCEPDLRSGAGMKKIKFGEVSIEIPNDKRLETMFSNPNPEFFKDLFTLTHSSLTNYLEECAKCAEKYAKTGKSDKKEDE
jgi:hypothetical protein